MAVLNSKKPLTPSIFYSKLLWQILIPVFLSVLVVELISLYPLIFFIEKQTPHLPLQSDFFSVHGLFFNLIAIKLTLTLLISLFTTVIIYMIVLKNIRNIKAQLLKALANPTEIEAYLFNEASPNELGSIQFTLNELLKRLNSAQKIAKAHDSLLEMNIAERTKEINQLTNYDPESRLPNRNLLELSLSKLIEKASHENKAVALLILRLNDFHEINNAYGAEIGSELIKQVSKDLTENTPIGSCIARISRSGFAIARGELTETHQIANLAQWIIDLFAKPFDIKNYQLLSTINIGIAYFPMDALNTQTLITNADIALRRAHDLLPNTYQFYESNMNQLIEARREMMVELHYALERNELVAYYQPQFDLTNHKIVGVETLLRWNHPRKGLIPPSFFIPLAEESGFIISMSEWILKTACQQALQWQKKGLPPLTVAVNLSGNQFKQQNIVDIIKQILIETKLPPQQLEVEITESIIVNNLEKAIYTMKALRKLGLTISLDDFGTGYSSLSYLTRFPVQKLKIDQSFVKAIEFTEDGNAIVDIILLLAKKLKLDVIAEGIETETQAHYLRTKGCRLGQGYLYGKPMSADEIVKLFK